MLCGTRAWQGGPRVVGGGYKAPFGLSESPNEDANCPEGLSVASNNWCRQACQRLRFVCYVQRASHGD